MLYHIRKREAWIGSIGEEHRKNGVAIYVMSSARRIIVFSAMNSYCLNRVAPAADRMTWSLDVEIFPSYLFRSDADARILCTYAVYDMYHLLANTLCNY